MRSLGLNYILNDETCAAFYRNLVRDGIGNGYALVSALMVGDEVVATLLSAALSWRGSPYGLRDDVVRAVRNHPRLMPG